MSRQVLLLRGINLGARKRVSMPQLRKLLEAEGFEHVRTYLQSGNVVLSTTASPEELAEKAEQLIAARLGLDVRVVVRTRDELAAVVRLDPLGDVAVEPKRYQVTFMAVEPVPEVVRKLEEAAVAPEQLVVVGREIYAWHPETIARSRLWRLLAGPGLGSAATSRNWATVLNLLALADEQS